MIILDAGHGGKDSGAVLKNGNKIIERESRINLLYTNMLAAMCCKHGVKCYLTRTEDSFISVAERVKLFNKIKANLVLSIHCNAHTDTGANGLEAYAKKPYLPLADGLCEKLKFLPYRMRGVKDGSFLFLPKRSKMPVILLELGFISNKDDYQMLIDPAITEDTINLIFSWIWERQNDNRYIGEED